MFSKLRAIFINTQINKIYLKNYKKNGTTPKSMFWNSSFNQTKRFEELIDFLLVIEGITKKISISDVGCGYGALYEFLRENNRYKNIVYSGVDINKKFIDDCKKLYKNINFKVSSYPREKVNYCLMSGTYNLTKVKDVMVWEQYIINNILECLNNVDHGVIFNLQYNNKTIIRNNIFYCEPLRILNLIQVYGFEIKYYKSKYFNRDVIFIIKKLR